MKLPCKDKRSCRGTVLGCYPASSSHQAYDADTELDAQLRGGERTCLIHTNLQYHTPTPPPSSTPTSTQLCAGKPALGGGGRVGSTICSVCPFPRCKHSHHGWYKLPRVRQLVYKRLTIGSGERLCPSCSTPCRRPQEPRTHTGLQKPPTTLN